MIIDIHTHIFPPEMRQDRDACFISEDAFYQLYSNQRHDIISCM